MATVAFQNSYVIVRHNNYSGKTIVFQLQHNVILTNCMDPTYSESFAQWLITIKGLDTFKICVQ